MKHLIDNCLVSFKYVESVNYNHSISL